MENSYDGLTSNNSRNEEVKPSDNSAAISKKREGEFFEMPLILSKMKRADAPMKYPRANVQNASYL